MNKCDFCEFSRPSSIISCGYIIFTIKNGIANKNEACRKALNKMMKYRTENNMKEGG